MSNEYRARSIEGWLKMIANGEIALPHFQRSYVWSEKKVKDLIYALLADRPAGTFLLIDFKNADGEERFRARPIRGQSGDLENCDELVLDGQQRLTSIYHALCNGFEGQDHRSDYEYFIKVDDIDKDQPEIKEIQYWKRGQRNKPGNPRELIQANLIPVGILGIDGVTQKTDALVDWCIIAKGNGGKEARNFERKIKKLFVHPMISRNLYYYKLPKDISREAAIDVFIKTNESAAVIKRFDIAVAQISEKREIYIRKNINDWVSQEQIVSQFFDQEEERRLSEVGELMLKVACLLQDKAPTDKHYIDDKVIEMLEEDDDFDRIQRGIRWAFQVLEEERIFHGKHLPSKVPLRVLPPLHAEYERFQGDNRGVARRLIKSYLWRSFLTDHYQRSANTRLKVDYDALLKDFQRIGSGENVVRDAPIFRQKSPALKTLSSLKESLQSPTTTNRLARAILCMSFREGAKDFASGEPITSHNVNEREAHHLFPRAFLEKIGVKNDKHKNHALNYASVSKPTNRSLGAKPPLTYLKERYLKDKDLKERELRNRVESHLIPFEELNVSGKASKTDYEDFLKKRASLIVKIIDKLIKGEPYP